MNNNEAIIVGLQKATDEYKVWLDQAELLVKGKANHIVKNPVAHTDCEFGLWLYSDGQQFSSLSEFKEVESVHQAFHQVYKSIFEGSKEVCDSESISALQRHFTELESQSALSIKRLEEMKQLLSGEITSPEVKEVKVDVKTPVDLRRQLKEQDLLQLQQEKQLTELELKQLEDRQRLTTQSRKQITQYQTLKEQEINQQLNNHKLLEDSNINDIFLGQQDLSRIKEEISSKHDELEQLVLVDQKLEKRKAEEEKKEQKILNDYEGKQSLDKLDLVKFGKQRSRWEAEAEKLQQQLMLIEQDLEELLKKELQSQRLVDKSNVEKDAKLQELMQQSRLQDKLNGHKIRVKEAKEGELKQLEEEQSSKQKNLKELERVSATLENQKVDIGKQHKKELKELNEQQRFKKMTIEKLERDQGRKKQELKELNHQQSAIQKSLDQMDSPQADTEKVLEEV